MRFYILALFALLFSIQGSAFVLLEAEPSPKTAQGLLPVEPKLSKAAQKPLPRATWGRAQTEITNFLLVFFVFFLIFFLGFVLFPIGLSLNIAWLWISALVFLAFTPIYYWFWAFFTESIAMVFNVSVALLYTIAALFSLALAGVLASSYILAASSGAILLLLFVAYLLIRRHYRKKYGKESIQGRLQGN